MIKLLYSEVLVVCIMVLIIIWHNDIKKSRGSVLKGQRIFRGLIWINVGSMIFDMVQVIYSGTMFSYSHLAETFSIFMYYLLHPAVGYVFALYTDYELYPDNERFKKVLPFYTIPEIINVIMSIASLWTGWFFVVDENNVYQRGTLFWIPTVICFGYVLWACILSIYWRKNSILDSRMQRELFSRLMLFPILPWVGGGIQLLLPGISVTFPGTTLAILFNYIAIQDSRLGRDHLTGLYNRSQLEMFMNNQLKNMKNGQLVFLILLDLDKFKLINDTYGHVVGDDALIQAANILRQSCRRKTDYVARLGGDEFVIIGQCEAVEVVEMIVKRMGQACESFNQSGKRPYHLAFSAGYSVCDGTSTATLDTLISEADLRMYEVKKAKKAKKQK